MERDVEVVRSPANAALKRVGAVLAGKRPEEVVLEGGRLLRDALRANHRLELLLLSEERAAEAAEWSALEGVGEVRVVQTGLLERVSDLATSPGVLALVPRPRALDAAELVHGPSALVLVVCRVADPGNLGALARSAEAAGASALAVVSGGARPFTARALRGSMGSLLRLPVVEADDPDALAEAFTRSGLRQVAAAARGGMAPDEMDWSGPLALWVAGETGALPAVASAFDAVTIPTAGAVESLNVAVAASVLLFAAGRNRESAP
ncbi:MAG: RNA methyltransferase [Planctomycetota bacterium]